MSAVAQAAVIVLGCFLAGIAAGIVAVFAISARRAGQVEERDRPEERDGDEDDELYRYLEDEPGADPGQRPWWHTPDDN
ncbi:MAG: hypothetical protein ABSA53_21440 [Streptosporangiaceae bacterium]